MARKTTKQLMAAEDKRTVRTVMNDTAPDVILSSGVQPAIIAKKRVFATGSAGYYGSGKVVIDGQMYQCTLQAVLVGSKPV